MIIMADIVEEVFTEEIDVGSSASTGSSSVTTDEFSFGQTPVAEPLVADDTELKNTTSVLRHTVIFCVQNSPIVYVSNTFKIFSKFFKRKIQF